MCVCVCVATADCRLLLAREITVIAFCPVDDKIYGIEIFPNNLTNLI